MGSVRTIAFMPPDECLDVGATDGTQTNVSNMVHLRCGVLMSRIEAEATRAGYDVVSWQTLRGFKRPIEIAADYGVDVIFEVNELTFNVGPLDTYNVATVKFYESDSSGSTEPLELDAVEKIAKRCQVERLANTEARGESVTLSVKLVTVKDGKVHWYFQRTIGEDSSTSGTARNWYLGPGGIVTAEQVICNPKFFKANGPNARTAEREELPSGNSYTFEKSQEVRGDPILKKRRRLVREVVRDFATELNKLKG